MTQFSAPLFPPRIWSRIVSRTNGRSLDVFKYACCCTSSTVKALYRYISFWSGLLLTINVSILLLCLKTSNRYPLFLRYLFPRLSEMVSAEMGVIYLLLHIVAVTGIVTGFVGVITTYTFSVIALKIFMMCNYLNMMKDVVLLIVINILLSKWHIAFLNVVAFFLTMFLLFLLVGLFTSFVSENLLFILDGERDESSTTQNTETSSESTNSRNTKQEDTSNKDLEMAKDGEACNEAVEN